MNIRSFILLAVIFISLSAGAQYTQQLRGTVTDHLLQQPLEGASIKIAASGQSVITDADGIFRFTALPVGTYKLLISYTGYKEVLLENIALNSGKELVLTIAMEPTVRTETELIVKATSKRNKPLNDMSVVSSRAFTVEETQKYAAAVNDPLRMVTAFPGVLAGDDGNNNIIIRGNSPTGLLWKMEGMDIPNPNHFTQPGLGGGGISILSSQLLANSDFVTAAFAAEYGNALSCVFDLNLRKGNNEKREYSLQAGVLGLNAAIEGPFSKKYKGSYLLNYRYSTLTVLNKIGVIPDNGVTNFQDVSYNIFLPTKKMGSFTVFGFTGLSDQAFVPDADSSKWEEKQDRYKFKFVSNTSMTGITHTILAGNKLSIKSGIGYAVTKIGYDEDFTENDLSLRKSYIDKYKTTKKQFNATANYRFTRQLNIRAGFIISDIKFDMYQLSAAHDGDPLEELVNVNGKTSTQQFFAQWQYKASDKLSFLAGLHYLRLAYNNTSATEPRLSAKWVITKRSSLAAGYGLHSQLQAMGIYFAQQKLSNGTILHPNKGLGLTRAHHSVLSYNYRIAANWQLKTEVYYQQLFNVPVSIYDTSTLSTLNIEYASEKEPMKNTGKGRNYGIELSLERYLRNNVYFTFTNSIYQSKYTAADGVERNTRFNGNYIATLIGGKDFVSFLGTKTFGINIKTIYAGGLRTTAIDELVSAQKGYAVFKEKEAFSLQNAPYFRTDLRLSMKWNRKHHTSTLSLDIQNITNRLNVFGQTYNDEKNIIETIYQTGLIPILNYKIEF